MSRTFVVDSSLVVELTVQCFSSKRLDKGQFRDRRRCNGGRIAISTLLPARRSKSPVPNKTKLRTYVTSVILARPLVSLVPTGENNRIRSIQELKPSLYVNNIDILKPTVRCLMRNNCKTLFYRNLTYYYNRISKIGRSTTGTLNHQPNRPPCLVNFDN